MSRGGAMRNINLILGGALLMSGLTNFIVGNAVMGGISLFIGVFNIQQGMNNGK